MARDIEPATGKVNPQRGILGGSDPLHQLGGGDRFILGRSLRKNDIFGPDLGTKCPLKIAVLIILGNSKDIGLQSAEILHKVQPMIHSPADHHLINHAQCFQDTLLMLIRQ